MVAVLVVVAVLVLCGGAFCYRFYFRGSSVEISPEDPPQERDPRTGQIVPVPDTDARAVVVR